MQFQHRGGAGLREFNVVSCLLRFLSSRKALLLYVTLVIFSLLFVFQYSVLADAKIGQFKSIILQFKEVKYETPVPGVGYVGYVVGRPDGKEPRIVCRDKENRAKVVDFDSIACLAFSNAVLHRYIKGSYSGIDYKPQTVFGGAALADHFKLQSAGRFALTKISFVKLADGIYYFDLRNKHGWSLGRNVEGKYPQDGPGGVKAMGHVGFVVVSEGKIQTYQMSSVLTTQNSGLLFDVSFQQWAKNTKYWTSKEPSEIEFYKI